MRFGSVAVGHAQPMCAVDREQLHSRVMIHHIEQERAHLRTKATWDNWGRAHHQFGAHLHQLYGDIDAGWRTCIPKDVLAYIYEVIPSMHRGRQQDAIAASTLKSLISNVGVCLEMRGRGAAWDELSCTGNPVHSLEVRRALEAYSTGNAKQGIRERSAVPMSSSKLSQLMYMLDADITSQLAALPAGTYTLPVTMRCNLRDHAHLLYIWGTTRRGRDAHQVDWEEVHVQQGESITAVQKVWACSATKPNLQCKLLAVPRFDKTSRGKRPSTHELCSSDPAQPHLCGVRALHRLFEREAPAQFSNIARGPVFTTACGERMTSSAACNRVKTLLQRYQLYEGETMHGFRRGIVQVQQAAGVPAAEIMRRAGMRTPENFEKYADSGRHLA